MHLFLGIVLKIKGNWVLVGRLKDYEYMNVEEIGWIHLKNKNQKSLLWFIWVDRC